MGDRRRGARGPTARAAAALVGVLVGVLVGLLSGPGPAAAEAPRPTADPAAPTPTTPYPGRPPQGSAPDGSTVGGEDLDDRGVVVDDDAPPLPAEVVAAGWLVADAGTGEVLAARDPHGRFYPASTLKTLTLLTLLPLLDPAEVVAATAEDEQVEGSKVGIVVGGEYPVGLLFQALMMQSGNDAANALARTAGGVETTVAAMNETAEHLGAFDTVAGSPSGLDIAGQSSSPYDLALIFRALLQDPAAVAILQTRTAQMPPVPGRSPGWQIQNQNPLLATYPGAIGGKTGFTDAARHTFVGAAERDGRVLVVSVMDTENVPLRAADQAALLLDWGFALPADVDPVGELVEPGEVPTEAPATTIPPPTVAPPVVSAEQPAAATAGEDDSTLVPLALGGTAVLIGVATLIGRRRAVRPVPVASERPAEPGSTGPASPPPPTGGSPSTRP
jgi:D-alanyl-D-alanine carboxypeptidase (penicillin-binding protein 5/6)